ncbi:SMI1/KNR4 family protein [Anaerobacillus sp. CMMVII]|uniref:SMI1/KNR4 family protein n=1 Tax=Anaerobacillus sp. CMMVII TaxID=2755588 RepID=UPI0021B7046F|nr:SMI1/KNR4 family protein [Anaerobacillus sp. CMMVII]MCT8137601.1 SMI1/KNR4 family protein [Anaerobacillus sp. CMMVII]
MMDVLNILNNADITTVGPVDEEVIAQAEKDLQVAFPKSYKEIIKQYGVISAGTDEIFGLGVSGYLNVVVSTKEERTLANGELDKYVVIQNLGIEGILIVVDENDNVFEYANGVFTNLFSTTEEYIKSQILK